MAMRGAAQTPRESILEELYYAGGKLSHSELILATHLPYDVVRSEVEKLEQEGEVEVINDGVPLVRLPSRGIS
jgi:hypothetical protein